MLDKTRLGSRYTCFECQTKFYDLNREIPTCPECGADQREAPVQDVKSLLSKGGGRRKKIPEPEEEVVKPAPKEGDDDEEDEEEEGEELNLLGDDDDDDLE
ncbi:MAG: FYDLN acid domain-containing protein [Myxococcales bacterium]|nr:FYDLN acid domain-containing protein [Myxococcales bacterium]